jgi:nucleotide-binding universal stress UspA family protein
MDLASALAKREDAEWHVVHVWQVASGYRLKRPFGWAKHRQVEWDPSVREQTKTALFCPLDAREDGIWGRAHRLKGRPANPMLKLAEQERVDPIVMGTVCRTGVPGIVTVNTAESILQQIECSVLTIKPDAFVTPVASERYDHRERSRRFLRNYRVSRNSQERR